jgi:enoyl-CoA hydratase/carnithine racemase
MDVVSIAGVEGRAWGAGFELALGCNLIVATETASFALPEIRIGLIPPIARRAAPYRAARRAMEWILTGSAIGARRLEDHGVINRIYSVDAFDEPLAAFVAEITGKSAPVLQLAKRAQYEAYYSSFPDAMANIQSLYMKRADGAGGREGRAARLA